MYGKRKGQLEDVIYAFYKKFFLQTGENAATKRVALAIVFDVFPTMIWFYFAMFFFSGRKNENEIFESINLIFYQKKIKLSADDVYKLLYVIRNFSWIINAVFFSFVKIRATNPFCLYRKYFAILCFTCWKLKEK